MSAGVGQNLNYVAVLDFSAQRHDPPVYPGAGAGVAHFRVNHIAEVYRCSAARQLNHFAHRRERVDIFGIKVQLEGIEKITRILNVLSPLDERAQGLQSVVIIVGAALPFLVLPVSGYAVFGDAMHLFGAYLNFKRLALGTDDRRVEGLIKVIARSCNPVLDSPRHRFPIVMDDPQRGVAVSDFIRRNRPCRNQIIDLIQLNFLPAQLFPN